VRIELRARRVECANMCTSRACPVILGRWRDRSNKRCEHAAETASSNRKEITDMLVDSCCLRTGTRPPSSEGDDVEGDFHIGHKVSLPCRFGGF
jgi:hypothetical protein